MGPVSAEDQPRGEEEVVAESILPFRDEASIDAALTSKSIHVATEDIAELLCSHRPGEGRPALSKMGGMLTKPAAVLPRTFLMVNLIIFAICVIFLFSGGDERGLAPFAIASSLALVIHIGMLLGLKDSDFIAVVALMHSPRAAMAEELSVMQTRLGDARDSVGGHMDHPHDVVEDTGESSMELLAENSDDDISYDCSSMYDSIPEPPRP